MAKLGRPKLFDVRETIRLSAIMHTIIRFLMKKDKKTLGQTVRNLIEESPRYKDTKEYYNDFPPTND